ncbi:MFS transporter, partial [Kitasatospora sp. NPDC056531]|uniref:MFS transporter n=1 Tax=Kitasatospora sp. NPDC056531 TaxID=3345856 RepID=UPI00368DE52C
MTGDGLAPADHPPPAFTRDRLTTLTYAGLAVYAYLLYALGPLLPLLRHDLHLSYAMMSLHSTAFAAGAVLTNLLFRRARRRFGHRPLFWSALTALALGALLLATGVSAAATLGGAVVGGIGGALLQTTALAALAEHHGGHEALRARALVEANAAASLSALAAPLVISGLQLAGAAWNWSLLLPAFALAALYPAFRREPLRPRDNHPAGAGGGGGGRGVWGGDRGRVRGGAGVGEHGETRERPDQYALPASTV